MDIIDSLRRYGYNWNMTLNMTEWNLTDEDGNLERPFEARPYLRPTSVDLDGDALVGHYEAHKMWRERRQPGRKMLEDFIKLADATPERILSYARRWGFLNLCSHELPYTHNAAPPPFGPVPTDEEYRAIEMQCSPARREPLAVWRRYAEQMGALLRFAAQFYGEEQAEFLDTAWLREYGFQGSETTNRTTAFDLLARPLDRWMWEANVRPRLKYPEGQLYSSVRRRVINPKPLAVVIGGEGAIVSEGLFGDLVLQLLLAVSNNNGFARCSQCKEYYSPSRMPNPKRRNFCQKCQAAGMPARLASHDYRARS